MKRETIIAFRTYKEIKEALEKLAKEERRSLSSVIEILICQQLKSKDPLHEFKIG